MQRIAHYSNLLHDKEVNKILIADEVMGKLKIDFLFINIAKLCWLCYAGPERIIPAAKYESKEPLKNLIE